MALVRVIYDSADAALSGYDLDHDHAERNIQSVIMLQPERFHADWKQSARSIPLFVGSHDRRALNVALSVIML